MTPLRLAPAPLRSHLTACINSAYFLALLATVAFVHASAPPHSPVLPAPVLPAQFSTAQQTSAPSVDPEHIPVGQATELATWWRAFGDTQLDDFIARATVVNHEVRLAQARLREARALAGVASAAERPRLDASGAANRRRISANSDNGQTASAAGRGLTGDVYRVGFDASWELDFAGYNRAQSRAARAEAAAAEEARRGTLISILAEVGANYIELRGAQQELRLLEHNLRLQAEAVALAEDRQQAGLGDELDALQARTRLAATRTRLPVVATMIAQATHRLGVLLDRAPGELTAALPMSTAATLRPPHVPLGLPSELLLRRPDLRQAEQGLAATSARLAAARADRWPRFLLTGTAGLESLAASDLLTGGSRAWSLGPGLHWPLLSGGRIWATIAAQDARSEQAALRYEQAVLQAFAEVEDALVNYGQAQNRLAAAQSAATASQQTAHLSADRHRAGLTDFRAVLDAERDRLDAEQLAVQLATATSRHLIALYKALGGGWQG